MCQFLHVWCFEERKKTDFYSERLLKIIVINVNVFTNMRDSEIEQYHLNKKANLHRCVSAAAMLIYNSITSVTLHLYISFVRSIEKLLKNF